MSTEQQILFNFLPITTLRDHRLTGEEDLQQINDYFRQIDESFQFLLRCLNDVADGGEDEGEQDTVEGTFPTEQAGLSALRVVAVNPDTGAIRDADSSMPVDSCEVIGISLNAGPNIGDMVRVLNSGFLTDSSFNFDTTIDPTLFLNGVGVISQTPPTSPTSNFNLQIGQVVSSDTILVQIAQPITLI